MKKVHDQRTKEILKSVAGSITRLETNREIPGHVLEADVWIEPDPTHESDLQTLGTLGRMIAMGPCLIEPYSDVPQASEVRSCILKQYSLDHAQRRDARAEGNPAPPFPRLWIIAMGSPDSVIEAMELRPMEGWPAGCFHGPPFGAFHLIVVRKLPKSPATVLLRLLSRDHIFRDALHDLAKLPETFPELAKLVERVMRVLVVFKEELDQDQLEEDEMEALRDIDAAYEAWERRVKAEGKAEGRAEGKAEGKVEGKAEGNREGLIRAIRSLCHRYEIELTGERIAQLETQSDEQLLRVLAEISDSHQWPQS